MGTKITPYVWVPDLMLENADKMGIVRSVLHSQKDTQTSNVSNAIVGMIICICHSASSSLKMMFDSYAVSILPMIPMVNRMTRFVTRL